MQDILVAPFSGVVDALLERTLEVRYRFSATSEPHAGAEVVATSLAGTTIVARHADLQSHALANLEARNSLADRNYNSSRLMA